MDKTDIYFTVSGVSSGIFKDRGSKFISFAQPVSTHEEAKKIIENYRIKYHDARHHCYAYIIGPEGNNYRQYDDNEPSGTAGKPILGQIRLKKLTNTIIVVIRYFGGTLLGTGGLINAYRNAASEALNNANIIKCYIYTYYSMTFPWSKLNTVMKILKDSNALIKKQEYGDECIIIAGIRLSLCEHAVTKLSEHSNIIIAPVNEQEKS
ncbi:MAG: YigZ family protein [Bacteroidales bacterium]|nr:YigZ family protein [Bacteroidales bacterium]